MKRLAWLSLWVLMGMVTAILFLLNAPSAAGNSLVSVDKETNFNNASDFNYVIENSFGNDPNNILPWPETRTSKVNGNVASVSLSAGPGHAGIAGAVVGIEFDWDLGDNTWDQIKNRQVTITISGSYQINADFVYGFGSANAGVNINQAPWSQPWFDIVGYEAGQQPGFHSTPFVKDINTTIEEMNGWGRKISVSVYCQTHLGEQNTQGLIHSSSAIVTISSIKIKPKINIYGLFIGVTKTSYILNLMPTTLKGAEAAQRLEGVFKNNNNVAYTLSIPINLDYTGGVDKELIHSAIKGINTMMRPGDIFFFYFTGHGGQVKTENTYSEFLVCGMDINSFILDNELPFWLKEMNPAISKWIVIEACHSGGFLEDLNNYGLMNFSFLASAMTDKVSWYDFSGFGLFDQALYDAFKQKKDGYTFNELYSYILAWKQSHLYHYVDTIVYEMDQGDPILYSDDLFIPVGFKSPDFVDGMPTRQKSNSAAADCYLLLLD
jgi:hypothetical protein